MGIDQQVYCHCLFGTKNLVPCLSAARREDLFEEIRRILNSLSCHDGFVGGVEDHVHLLAYVHPDLSVDAFMRAVKDASAKWIKENDVFTGFPGWQKGYIVLSISPEDRASLIEYIESQEAYHHERTYEQEVRVFLDEMGYQDEVPDFS